ncbi:MAG: hypothetical protein ACRC92_20725 [Peptostreptococcaceae bacterium]
MPPKNISEIINSIIIPAHTKMEPSGVMSTSSDIGPLAMLLAAYFNFRTFTSRAEFLAAISTAATNPHYKETTLGTETFRSLQPHQKDFLFNTLISMYAIPNQSVGGQISINLIKESLLISMSAASIKDKTKDYRINVENINKIKSEDVIDVMASGVGYELINSASYTPMVNGMNRYFLYIVEAIIHYYQNNQVVLQQNGIQLMEMLGLFSNLAMSYDAFFEIATVMNKLHSKAAPVSTSGGADGNVTPPGGGYIDPKFIEAQKINNSKKLTLTIAELMSIANAAVSMLQQEMQVQFAQNPNVVATTVQHVQKFLMEFIPSTVLQDLVNVITGKPILSTDGTAKNIHLNSLILASTLQQSMPKILANLVSYISICCSVKSNPVALTQLTDVTQVVNTFLGMFGLQQLGMQVNMGNVSLADCMMMDMRIGGSYYSTMYCGINNNQVALSMIPAMLGGDPAFNYRSIINFVQTTNAGMPVQELYKVINTTLYDVYLSSLDGGVNKYAGFKYGTAQTEEQKSVISSFVEAVSKITQTV